MRSPAPELIREAYEAYNADRIAEWATANLPAEFELIPLAPVMGAGFIGPHGLARFFAEIKQAWEASRIEIEEVADFGDRVVALGRLHNRGRGSGMELDVVAAHLWTVEDDVPVSVELIGDREEALRRGRTESLRGSGAA